MKKTYYDFIEKLKRLTENNHHNEARILIAEYFDFKSFVKIFKAIDIICKERGEIEVDLFNFRKKLVDELLTFVNAKMADEIKSCL